MLRLMLVDDEPAILAGLRDLFPWQEWGFQVAGCFANGREALAQVPVLRPHVVLTDIRMPDLDGIELARQLQERWPRIVVAFLSAHADFEYGQQGIRYGVKDFLTKPIRIGQLESAMRRLSALCPASDEKGLANEVKDYLEQHLADASVDGAAAEIGLPAAELSAQYHRMTGITFTGALYEARMAKAASLVSSIDARMGDVAFQLGYDNAKNFSRAFRNYYGMSPSEYRNRKG